MHNRTTSANYRTGGSILCYHRVILEFVNLLLLIIDAKDKLI